MNALIWTIRVIAILLALAVWLFIPIAGIFLAVFILCVAFGTTDKMRKVP